MSIQRNTLANFLGQGWSALIGIALLPVYVKHLGIEAYALIGFFVMLSAWAGLLDLGLTQTLGREMARYTGADSHLERMRMRDLLRTTEAVVMGLAVLVVACISGGADWISVKWLNSSALPRDEVSRSITLMGAAIAFRLVENIYRACLLGLQRHVLYNVANAVMVTLRWPGAAFVIVFVESSIEAFFVWQCLVSVLTVTVFCSLTYRLLPGERAGRFSVQLIREVRSFAGGMFAISLLGSMLTQIDKILLSKLLSLADFGYYTLASTVAGGLLLLAAPIVQALYPRMCQEHAADEQGAFARTFQYGVRLINVVVGTAAIILIVYAHSVLLAWTRDVELAEQTSLLLGVLALGNLMNALMLMPFQATLAYGWTAFAIRVNLVAISILVPAVILVAPSYGSLGMGWLWVALNAGYLLVATYFLFSSVLRDQKSLWVWRIFKSLAGGTAIALAFRGAEHLLHAEPLAKVGLMGLATCCVLFYMMYVNEIGRLKLP